MENASDNVFAPPRASLETQEGPQALWEMPFKDLRKLYHASVNVNVLGVLYGLGAFGALLGGLGGASFWYSGRNPDTAVSAVLMAVMFVLGFLYLAGTISSYTRPRWGRWVGVVLCLLSLLSIPFGTLIGALGLVAYARAGKLFGPERLPHKEVTAVYKQRKKDKK